MTNNADPQLHSAAEIALAVIGDYLTDQHDVDALIEGLVYAQRQLERALGYEYEPEADAADAETLSNKEDTASLLIKPFSVALGSEEARVLAGSEVSEALNHVEVKSQPQSKENQTLAASAALDHFFSTYGAEVLPPRQEITILSLSADNVPEGYDPEAVANEMAEYFINIWGDAFTYALQTLAEGELE